MRGAFIGGAQQNGFSFSCILFVIQEKRDGWISLMRPADYVSKEGYE